MEAPGSGFAPLFRSDQQLTLLCFLFVLMPGGHMTMTQLAAATDTSASTVSREVARLETAGIVVVETIGRAKLVGANWASPIARPLHMMLSQMCGPLRELVALYGVPGVVSLFVFGSWAERYVGIPGPYPNDVDVLIIGDNVDQLSIQMACHERRVNFTSSPEVLFSISIRWSSPSKNGPMTQTQAHSSNAFALANL